MYYLVFCKGEWDNFIEFFTFYHLCDQGDSDYYQGEAPGLEIKDIQYR